MNDLERRYFAVEGLKIETRDGKPAMISGHAAVFNTLSQNLGGFREQIKPGAFSETIGKDDIRALFNHDPNFVLGRNIASTLRLMEDERGLAIEVDAPDSQTIRDLVLGPIARGDISQMSFGFAVVQDGQDWAEDGDGMMIRTLSKVRLFDVSPVTFPAYTATDVAVREMRSFQARVIPPAVPMNLIRARDLQARI
jgi:HK97 family phage prohead protease